MLLFSQLKKILAGNELQLAKDRAVEIFLTDSRKAIYSDTTCFFAISGPRNDGHLYIHDLYEKGIRQFVVEREPTWRAFPEANFFVTPSSLQALQSLAQHHREQFHFPVVGITGSNGKTIIKEWLYQLLSPDFNVVKNPGSYNSQLGVPLSVLQIQSHHDFGLFEAGISRPGEMEVLQSVIQPTIGILSNIGSAHDEGFADRNEKIHEKLKLFSGVSLLVYCADNERVHQAVSGLEVKTLSWGTSPGASVHVAVTHATVVVTYQQRVVEFHFPFSDKASVENLTHCVLLLLHLGKSPEIIQERIRLLKSVPMRLELKQGVNQCQIIDDTYNNDLAGLQISVNFLSAQQKKSKTLILSDILQSGLAEKELIKNIAAVLRNAGIEKLVTVGPVLKKNTDAFHFIPTTTAFLSTQELLEQLSFDQFHGEVILLKGARIFQFEKITARLQKKIHGTVMEVDLNALVSNLNYFKSKLTGGVKLMVMVKAFAYGSGSEEVANLLQYHRVNYLGVAYADEGVDLRKNQITLPIMVMNPSEESFGALLQYNLEPEVYSLKIMKALIAYLEGRPCRIHIKLDTGMHRLGFTEEEIEPVIDLLAKHSNLKVASIFTHLAGSDEHQHDEFSRQQVEIYKRGYQKISEALHVQPIRHVLNSPGILRFPEFQFDMVRLGIGLYGVNPTSEKVHLKPVATLKTVISQIKNIAAGETIGYGRRGVAEKELTLATIAIGYADGFSRSFSRGTGLVLVNGKRAPVIGNVCMDMTMIDITGIEAQEGDEVIVFGKELPIYEVAARINTIPYEILTNTSERVKRVFHMESI